MAGKKKLLLVSSSGGHFEQLKCLKPLASKHDCIVVTEKTAIKDKADYYVIQTGHKDKLVLPKLLWMAFQELYIFIKERPDYIISTGTIVILPFACFAKFTKTKLIYIESFAKRTDSTKSGKFIYSRHLADLFIIQWESLRTVYPDAIYGGSLY